MFIFNKKHTMYFTAVLFIIAVIILLIINLSPVSKGCLKIYDSSGNILAEYSFPEDSLSCTYKNTDNYINLVTDEAVRILNNKYLNKTDINKIEKSDLKIKTYFSVEDYKYSLNSINKFNYSDGKSSEIALCDTKGRILSDVCFKSTNAKLSRYHKAGSALKPLSVYAPAFKNNIINWSTPVSDIPMTKIKNGNQYKDWPSNYNNTYLNKNITLTYSVEHSLNTVAANTLKLLTPKKSCDFLSRLDINVDYESKTAENKNNIGIYGNLALGELNKGITCTQMAGAYQIFTNGGIFTKPRCIYKIYSGKKLIYKDNNTPERLLDKSDAEILNQLLQNVVNHNGTGSKAKIEGIKIGGKTGTSEGYRDNWFVGFTPDVVCSVWYGYRDNIDNRINNSAVEIFRDVMLQKRITESDYPHSENTVFKKYCLYSGMLANSNCNHTSTGYFNSDKLPAICNKH